MSIVAKSVRLFPGITAPSLFQPARGPLRPAVPARSKSPLRRDLAACSRDGQFFSVMVGMGESYLAAFVLAAGLGQISSGLIGTVPIVLGGILQLISPFATRRLGSNRLWVVSCATTQALSFLTLSLVAYLQINSTVVIFATASLYWGAGLGAGPAWNTWVGTVIPSRIRSRYFACRTRVTQICVLGGFLTAGIALQWGVGLLSAHKTFAILFLIAAVARFASVSFLLQQTEPVRPERQSPFRSVRELFTRFTTSRILVFQLAVQFSVQIAGPYFSPYLLAVQKFEYWQYAALIATAFIAKIVTVPLMGKLADKMGARRLFLFGAFGLVPLSSLWLVSSSFAFLLLVQLIAGTVWGAYELASLLLLFDSIESSERTSIMTVFNLLNATAMTLGSLAGAGLLLLLGNTLSTYCLLFGLSTASRLLALLLLPKLPRTTEGNVQSINFRTLAMRPSAGSIDRPIVVNRPKRASSEGKRQGTEPVPVVRQVA